LTYVYWLKHIGILLRQDFEESTTDDIRRVASEIERSNYTDYTKDTIKVMLKRFYKWLRGTDDYPPEVKWIRLLAEKMAESCLRKSSRTTMLRPWLTLQIVPETERWF
jgi:hypothetical protein